MKKNKSEKFEALGLFLKKNTWNISTKNIP